jgi:hypothetical protein
MQRSFHVLADVDDGRAADLILPHAISGARAVIVAANDQSRLMLLNRIPPPRMTFDDRTGGGQPCTRRRLVHDPNLPRRIAVVFEQLWKPEAVMLAAERFSFGKRLLLAHRTGKADHADTADFCEGAIQPKRGRLTQRTLRIAKLEPVLVFVIAPHKEERHGDCVKLHRALRRRQLPSATIRQ